MLMPARDQEYLEVHKAQQSDLCGRPYCNEPSIGFLPMPQGKADISVCSFHYEEARQAAFLVIKHGEDIRSASARQDRLLALRHLLYRGTNEVFGPVPRGQDWYEQAARFYASYNIPVS